MIWLNGKLQENGVLDATNAATLLGWGVFTTVGIRDGAPTFLRRHFERLQRDARAADIEFVWKSQKIEQGLTEVLRAQKVVDGLARLTLTQRGDGRWKTQIGADLSIMALATETQNQPMRAQLSPYRVEAKRPLASVKTTAYLPYLWAWREAKSNGFDEAIMRNGGDFLCEGARSSLFWIENNELWTSAPQTGCLLGVGRDLVLEWARLKQISVHEGEFESAKIESAQEIWLVSAAGGVRPVSSWHDENGALIWQCKNEVSWQNELLDWWEIQSKV